MSVWIFQKVQEMLWLKLYSQLLWFNTDDCSRVANNSGSFAFNSVLAPRIDANNVVEKSPCLQFEPIISAVRYT